jgi:hypothetical protein
VSPTTVGRRCCSLSGFKYLSPLAEECEAVGEARAPRKVVEISGFHRRCDESFMLKLLRQGSPIVCVQLEGTVPWWRSLRCCPSLQRVATLGVHNIGDDDAIHRWLLLASLPVCGGVVFCCVGCSCALFVWWFSLQRVMYNCCGCFFFS